MCGCINFSFAVVVDLRPEDCKSCNVYFVTSSVPGTVNLCTVSGVGYGSSSVSLVVGLLRSYKSLDCTLFILVHCDKTSKSATIVC